jgi:putative hydrolase of the HAD superfamily
MAVAIFFVHSTSILSENKLNACETLFVDDSIQHILGAKQAGLHTLHISKEKSIFDVLIFLEKIKKSEELEEKRNNDLIFHFATIDFQY